MFFAAVMLKTWLLGWMLSTALMPRSSLFKRRITSFLYDNSMSLSRDSDQASITLLLSAWLILHPEIVVLRVERFDVRKL